MMMHKRMLDFLVHASRCRFGSCQYPECRRFKELFQQNVPDTSPPCPSLQGFRLQGAEVQGCQRSS
ncbi:hypothetical protein ACP70R_030004 [Stipagrostis hirtigluma subsp. patula]